MEAALRALPLSRDLELGRCDVLGTLLCADDTAGLTPGVISSALISSSSGTTKRSTGWSRTG